MILPYIGAIDAVHDAFIGLSLIILALSFCLLSERGRRSTADERLEEIEHRYSGLLRAVVEDRVWLAGGYSGSIFDAPPRWQVDLMIERQKVRR